MLFTTASIQWLEALIEERFGVRFVLSESSQGVRLSLPNTGGAVLFDTLQSHFHESCSDLSCGEWDARAEGWEPVSGATPIPAPGSGALPVPLIEAAEHGFTVHYDILGLTYWMLTRLEEVGRTDLDAHGRFPATSSHAYKYGYLERPIVDEWLIILRQVIERQWSELKLTNPRFSMKVSHDVDHPARYAFQSPLVLLNRVVADVIRRKDFNKLVLGPWIWLRSYDCLHPSDPFNVFDWIMDVSEKRGLQSAFYFICGRTNVRKDAAYDIEDKSITNLIRSMSQRGHEIGLHPSYETYLNPEQLQLEASRLKTVCSEIGVRQSRFGGRMHFLRWSQSVTLRAWELADLEYDSTLGYADKPGFRCGTCHEYPAFDPAMDNQLSLRVRPLIAMECTVLAKQYLNLGAGEAALTKFVQLKDACRSVSGSFTLLWHNSQLITPVHRELYLKVLDS